MKKFKITRGDRVYIVDAKSHIDAINKVKSVKDSSIKDYSPEVYVNELEKLIPEYQRLGDLKGKIRESLVTSGKTDKSKMGPDFKIILSDAKVQQWVKQVRELDKKWNNILTNLNRFGANVYKQQSNGSDLDVWLNSLPDSWTISDIKFAVKSESRKYRDSISQWKPGMSEIGLFQISYKKGTVNQSILVKAATKEDAINKFTKHKPDAEVIGVNEYPNPHFGEPILDSKMKDDSYYYLLRDAIDLLTKPGAARGWSQPYLEEVQEYMIQKGINPVNVNQWKKKYESLTKDSDIKDEWSGVRSNGVIFNYSNGKYTITHKNGKVETFPGNKFNTAEELFKYIDNIKDSKVKDSGINYGTLFIDLNSPNELTASKIVQELKNEIGNNKIAEIRGGSFTPLREYGSASLDLDFKEFKNNEWGTNHIRLMVRSALSLPVLTKMKEDPKSAYKLRAELNNKLKQFANKTIYSNKSFTMDSKIKDIDEYKKNYASAMRAAGEKTKKDQINSDIQKLYDIAKQYGPIRTEQNKLNNEFEQQNMQVVRNRFYNDPTVKRALKQMEDLDKKWDAIIHKYPKLIYRYAIDDEGPNRFMGSNTPTKKWVDDIKKQLIKDSAIKDMPLMFKSNVNMQSLKSNIDNVKNKPNETYINSLNANIQGIIADIEEIKSYEKDGKFNESPALKFSCKNLTAQYYKLLNDPKLQGTLHKLDEPTYKNVLYAEHQAQMLSQVTLK